MNFTILGAIASLALCVYGTGTCPPVRSNEFAVSGPTWTKWGACDHNCGGGTKTRSGQCRYSMLVVNRWWSVNKRSTVVNDKTTCNEVCFHGRFVGNACQCLPGIKGRCCEIVPVCNPACENGGTCIANNMCKCQSGFFGQWCEIENKARVAKDLNRSGHVIASAHTRDKINIHAAAHDTIVNAESVLTGNPNTLFGNYTAGPIDANGYTNGTSRFSCLEVKCPGFTFNGTKIDVSVNVTVTSRYRACSLRNHSLGLAQLSKHASDNGLSFTMEEGHNYGSLNGIFTGMGFRDKANYIAQHSCFSGHRFDLTHVHPTLGVLADFICN